MRVTAETKRQTRNDIVQVARRLFAQNGLAATTTRDIAAAAGIGVGTLFNYFPTKESLALFMIDEFLEAARTEFHATRRGEETLDELLFLHAALALRHLRPVRLLTLPVFESTLCPVTQFSEQNHADKVRAGHLAVVRRLICDAGTAGVSLVTLHLYWTLFLGVIAFWSQDNSNNQEETLALLDQSMRMFANQLAPSKGPSQGVLP